MAVAERGPRYNPSPLPPVPTEGKECSKLYGESRSSGKLVTVTRSAEAENREKFHFDVSGGAVIADYFCPKR